jgi:hypothetical protein
VQHCENHCEKSPQYPLLSFKHFEGNLTNKNASGQMVMNYKVVYCGDSNGPLLHGARKVFQRIDLFVDAMKTVPDSNTDDESHSGQ